MAERDEDPRRLVPPEVSEELAAFLNRTHPPKCIGRDETVEQAHRRAGRRELVDNLMLISQLQHDHDLTEEQREEQLDSFSIDLED